MDKKLQKKIMKIILIYAVIISLILCTDLDLIVVDMIGTVGKAIYDLVYMIFG